MNTDWNMFRSDFRVNSGKSNHLNGAYPSTSYDVQLTAKCPINNTYMLEGDDSLNNVDS